MSKKEEYQNLYNFIAEKNREIIKLLVNNFSLTHNFREDENGAKSVVNYITPRYASVLKMYYDIFSESECYRRIYESRVNECILKNITIPNVVLSKEILGKIETNTYRTIYYGKDTTEKIVLNLPPRQMLTNSNMFIEEGPFRFESVDGINWEQKRYDNNDVLKQYEVLVYRADYYVKKRYMLLFESINECDNFINRWKNKQYSYYRNYTVEYILQKIIESFKSSRKDNQINIRQDIMKMFDIYFYNLKVYLILQGETDNNYLYINNPNWVDGNIRLFKLNDKAVKDFGTLRLD